jgi:hypothetical protein
MSFLQALAILGAGAWQHFAPIGIPACDHPNLAEYLTHPTRVWIDARSRRDGNSP